MGELLWYRGELAKERALLEALNMANNVGTSVPNRIEIIADVENRIRELEEAIARFESIIAAKTE